MSEARALHREFLNRYYGISRHFYDLTRKYYLFGRDRALTELLAEPWESLVEVGVGTGRNLRKLHDRRPSAMLGGIDASDEMLAHARTRCPWASFAHGFAEDFAFGEVLGRSPQRILFSYCLSMVGDPRGALLNARRGVDPGGSVVVVDFGDMAGLSSALRTGFRSWLETFHVHPVASSLLEEAKELKYGPWRYFFVARFSGLPG